MRIQWAILLLVLALVACTAETTPTGNAPTNAASDDAPAVVAGDAAGDTVEIAMIARNWEFEPGEIRVKRGDRVRITVTSEDVAHGIGIEGYGASVKVGAGETATLEFVADKSGEFRMFCNVFCGEGHRQMAAQLIVEE